MSNFTYIKELLGLDELYEFCQTAELMQRKSPRTTALNCRLALEWMMVQVYAMKNINSKGMTLSDMIHDTAFHDFIGTDTLFWSNIEYVRKLGNRGAHVQNDPQHKVTEADAMFCLSCLYYVLGYIFQLLRIIDTLAPFDKSFADEKNPAVAVLAVDKAPEVDQQFVASVPQHNVICTATPAMPASPFTEEETRARFIDLMLREAGWEVQEDKGVIKPLSACIEVEVSGMPSASGTGYADYVLFGNDMKPLAVIEAKKTSVGLSKGLHQAELYAECLEHKYGVRPVIYVSNGYQTEVIDGMGYPARRVYGFHSANDLVRLHQRRRERGQITDLSVNKNITNREYQIRAVRSVCEHLNKMNRRSLLIMATGTGKTRVSISLCDILMRNNWVKNILFLADRTSLVRQAHKNFVALLPDATTCILSERTEQSDMQARIMFSTYQTMVNYIDTTDTKEFSIGRFDLIIIDEAHRSVFGKYGVIFDYFDSFLVGLTATPRDEVARSTFDLLGMQPEDTFAYEYDEAIHDGYLVPYTGLKRGSYIMKAGIQMSSLAAEDKEQLKPVFDYEKAEDLLEGDERDIDESEIFKYIYNEDTIDKVLQDFMEKGLKVNEGTLIGKSIIFCYNHQHAELVVERFNKLYPELGSDFCVLIDNYVNYAQDLIDKFEVRGQMPQVAVSVDMLDTGIDVPDVLNLVFFKPVHSGIKFKQMIGRGTRLSDDIFGFGKDKEMFYIFDWCGNFDFFEVNPGGREAAPQTSLAEKIFCLRAELAAALQTAEHQAIDHDKALHDELKATLKEQTKALKDDLISVRKVWDKVVKFRDDKSWTYLSNVDVLELKDCISPLIPLTQEDIGALKFDALMLNIELSKVSEDTKSVKSQMSVIRIAHHLEDRAVIPVVKNAMPTIRKIQHDGFFDNADLSLLERVRTELRSLVMLLKGAENRTFTLNIEDMISDEGEVSGTTMTMNYRQKVLDYLRENRNLPVLQKIFRLEALTTEDISQLEKILWQELGTREDYERYISSGGVNVAIFIRSVIHVDHQVALDKFVEFLKSSTLNSRQEEYLKNVISYVSENGDIKPETLMTTAPFCDYDIFDTFSSNPASIGQYVRMLHDVIEAKA